MDPLVWVIFVLASGLDQLTKWLVTSNIALWESVPADGFFRITHVWNTGTAFGLFRGRGDLLLFVSLAAVVLLIFFYRHARGESTLVRLAVGLQFGGALGNIVDRVRLGHVTDFIDVGPWPIFNLADSAIVVGIAIMVFYFVTQRDAAVGLGGPPNKETSGERPGVGGSASMDGNPDANSCGRGRLGGGG